MLEECWAENLMTDAVSTELAAPEARPFVERRNVANHVLNSIGECAYEWDIERDHLL